MRCPRHCVDRSGGTQDLGFARAPQEQKCPRTKENLMAVKHKITVSTDTHRHSPTPTERRAALTSAIADEQRNLKREAAERRAKRAR